MNYIEYTNNFIQKNHNKTTLVICPGYNLAGTNVIVNDTTRDIADWVSLYRELPTFKLFDSVLISRVVEHIPMRDVDYHIFQLSTIMKTGANLVIIVPDMEQVTREMIKEYRKEQPNQFRIMRLNFEIFSEGNHVWDRHCLWTSRKSMKDIIEKEGLFKVKSIRPCEVLGSPLVPREILIVAIKQ
jgi:predicted SAM-dependent methyltransferase